MSTAIIRKPGSALQVRTTARTPGHPQAPTTDRAVTPNTPAAPLPPKRLPAVVAASLSTTLHIPTEALTITASPPDMLSQRNVEAVTGIPARVYLQEIRTPGFPLPVVKLGKLRLVERAAFLSYLRSLANGDVHGGPSPTLARCAEHEPDDEAADDGAVGVLSELGLAVKPSAKRKPQRKKR